MEPDSRGQLMINLHIDIDIFPGKSAREARRKNFWGYFREILGIFSGKLQTLYGTVSWRTIMHIELQKYLYAISIWSIKIQPVN